MSVPILGSLRGRRRLWPAAFGVGLLAAGCVQTPQSLVERTLSAQKQNWVAAREAREERQVAAADDQSRGLRSVLPPFLKRDDGAHVDPFLDDSEPAGRVILQAAGRADNVFVDGFDAELERQRAIVLRNAAFIVAYPPAEPTPPSRDPGPWHHSPQTIGPGPEVASQTFGGHSTTVEQITIPQATGPGVDVHDHMFAGSRWESDEEWHAAPPSGRADGVFEEMIVHSHLLPPRLAGATDLHDYVDEVRPRAVSAANIVEARGIRASANCSIAMASAVEEQFLPKSQPAETADWVGPVFPDATVSSNRLEQRWPAASRAEPETAEIQVHAPENVRWANAAEPAAKAGERGSRGGTIWVVLAAAAALGWTAWRRGIRPVRFW